jgi:hypothetical protein
LQTYGDSRSMKKYRLAIMPYDNNAREICERLNALWGHGVFRECRNDEIKHLGHLKWDDWESDIAKIQKDFPNVEIQVKID